MGTERTSTSIGTKGAQTWWEVKRSHPTVVSK